MFTGGLLGSRYTDGRRNVISTELGEMLQMKHSKTDLAVVAVHKVGQASHVFSSRTSPDIFVVDALMASSAAPTYFKPFDIKGEVFVDGGVTDNDPSMRGHTTALKQFGIPANKIRVWSFGTDIYMGIFTVKHHCLQG